MFILSSIISPLVQKRKKSHFAKIGAPSGRFGESDTQRIIERVVRLPPGAKGKGEH